MIAAAIDLGTNTFNILIFEKQNNQPFKFLLENKSAVMLGKEGINDGFIGDKALNRAFTVLRDFSRYIKDFKCEKVVAYGTSALRTSSNAHVLFERAKSLGINIEPISGDREAELIFQGVKQAVSFVEENYLVLDIGGGSNEFIIANKEEIKWKKSFKLGGARLLAKFKPDDPINANQIEALNEYLNEQLQELKDALVQYPVLSLVGSSGAFDSLASINSFRVFDKELPGQKRSSIISMDEFLAIHNDMVATTREERLEIKGLEEIRIDTIVMALLFTKFVVEMSGVKDIIQSAYSLKEGVAANM